MRSEGTLNDPDDIGHFSPAGFEQVNRLGI